MDYLVKIEAWITADSLEEAESMYENGDYSIDDHNFYYFNEDGYEVEA